MRMGDLQANANTNSEPWYRQLLSSVTSLGTAYLSFEQQQNLNEVNLQRAQMGQAALNAEDYAYNMNVGIGRSTQNTVLIAVAALAGVFLLSKALK